DLGEGPGERRSGVIHDARKTGAARNPPRLFYMAAPGVGCMISAGRYALGLDPVAHRAPSGSGDASPHELPRREDDGSNHGEPDERAHRRERMRDCEHAIVKVAPGAGKLHRPGMGPGVARLAADGAEAAVSAWEAPQSPSLRS